MDAVLRIPGQPPPPCGDDPAIVANAGKDRSPGDHRATPSIVARNPYQRHSARDVAE